MHYVVDVEEFICHFIETWRLLAWGRLDKAIHLTRRSWRNGTIIGSRRHFSHRTMDMIIPTETIIFCQMRSKGILQIVCQSFSLVCRVIKKTPRAVKRRRSSNRVTSKALAQRPQRMGTMGLSKVVIQCGVLIMTYNIVDLFGDTIEIILFNWASVTLPQPTNTVRLANQGSNIRKRTKDWKAVLSRRLSLTSKKSRIKSFKSSIEFSHIPRTRRRESNRAKSRKKRLQSVV